MDISGNSSLSLSLSLSPPPPKYSLERVNIRKVLNFQHLIFYFSGGPGSRKGKLLDDVSHVYGLKLISTETVLLEELSKKIENPNSNKRTEDIASLLKVKQ